MCILWLLIIALYCAVFKGAKCKIACFMFWTASVLAFNNERGDIKNVFRLITYTFINSKSVYQSIYLVQFYVHYISKDCRRFSTNSQFKSSILIAPAIFSSSAVRLFRDRSTIIYNLIGDFIPIYVNVTLSFYCVPLHDFTAATFLESRAIYFLRSVGLRSVQLSTLGLI